MKKRLLALSAVAVLSLGIATANAGSVINGLTDLASQITGVLGITNGGTGSAWSAGAANKQMNNMALLFPKLRKALAAVRNNSDYARILFVGDSTFQGTGTTGSPINSTTATPAVFAKLANTSMTPYVNGLAVPNMSGSASDTRWTAGSGWSNPTAFGAGSNACYQAATTATGTLVFSPSPAQNTNGFYVYYMSSGDTTSYTARATGGSPVTITPSATKGQYRSAFVAAGSSSTSNTLTITPPGSGTGTIYIVGVEPVLSTTKQVLIGNAGVGGSKTDDWAKDTVANPFYGTNFIKAAAADLTVISLGINDFYNGIAVSTSQANLQTIITAAKLSGDCLLVAPPPVQTDPGKSLESAYVKMMEDLAVANSCGFVDFYGRFGGAWDTNFMADFAHPSNVGAMDWAQNITSFLSSF